MSEAIVAEARRWIGTPFHWGQSCRGAGCDCYGLVTGVARELGLPEAEATFAKLQGYQKVDGILLKLGLSETFDEAAEMEAGDVLLLRVSGKAQHLAIYAGEGRMIHSYGSGPSRVVEVPMGHIWRTATESAWRWRAPNGS